MIAGTARFLVGRERDRLYADLLDAMPPETDPHLSRLTPAQEALPVAGALYAEWQGMRHRDNPRAEALWRQFALIIPPHAINPDSPAGQVARGGMAFGDATE